VNAFVGRAAAVHERAFQPRDTRPRRTGGTVNPRRNRRRWGQLFEAFERPITITRVPKRQVRFSRFNIYARDKLTCQYCHRRLPRQELNLDHVIPRSQGGVSTWENVVCSCHECNRRKGGRTPQQAGMLLARNPVRPQWTPFMQESFSLSRYREWTPFLNTVDASYWNTELLER